MTHPPDMTLIRRHVDGETTPEERRAFDHDDPDVRNTVLAERCLREHVGRALDRRAPADLRAGVAAILRGDETTPPPRRRDASEDGEGGPVLFRSPQRTNPWAVAAVLAIVAGAIAVGWFGRAWFNRPVTPDALEVLAAFVAEEHARVTVDPSHPAPAWPIEPDEATSLRLALAAHVGVDVEPPSLAEIGYALAAASPCPVPPVEVPAAHLLYAAPDGGRVSVFLSPHGGAYSLDEGCQRRLFMGPTMEGRAFASDGVVYAVVASPGTPFDAIARAIDSAIGPLITPVGSHSPCDVGAG